MYMARGWESKDVESQVDAAEERARLAKLTKLSDEETARDRERDSLQLSRKRVLHDIETAQNPRYRATLEAALKHLDEKLAALS
jgi:5'-3' exonuclease